MGEKRVNLSIPKSILVLAMVVGAIVMLALPVFMANPFKKSPFTKKPNPLNVSVKLVEDPVAGTIAKSGGSIKTTGVNSENLTIDIPKQALIEDEDISLKKIKSIGGLPKGWAFVTGIEGYPDGLQFLTPAKFTIELPKGATTKNLVGFAYENGGRNFHLVPFRVKGQTVTMQIDGFSGHGIITADGVPPNSPTSTSDQARQAAADAVRDAGRSDGQMSNETQKRLCELYKEWYKESIEPHLRAAEQNDELFDSSASEFLSWEKDLQFLGLYEAFDNEINEANKSMARGLKNSVDKANKICHKQKDPTQITKMLRRLKQAQILGLDGVEGLDTGAIMQKIKKCAVFELRITSSFVGDDKEFQSKASGSIKIRPDDSMLFFNGEGEIAESGVIKFGSPATANKPVVFSTTVTITHLDILNTKKPGQRLVLLLDLGDEQQVSYKGGQSAIHWDEGGWSSAWETEFDLAHEGEKIKDRPIAYRISDWEVVASNGIFVRKAYKRTVDDTVEDTVIEIVHTPDN